MADELSELATRAIKGDKAYAFTYYKKSTEDRAEDYRKVIAKLSVFGVDEALKVREQVEDAVKSMEQEELATLLEYIQYSKKGARRQ